MQIDTEELYSVVELRPESISIPKKNIDIQNQESIKI